MTGTVRTCCFLLPLLVAICAGQLSIPRRELGFVYNDGHPCATIKLAAYLDMTCPDSQAAYPTLKKVADHFGPSVVQLKVHLFPLPYHRNSHVLSKGAHVLSKFKSPTRNSTVYDWFDTVYDNLDQLVPSATASMTDLQVLDMVASMAQRVAGISPEQFKKQVADVSIDSATRLGWKYGCTRGVYGTPMFTVNDVFVSAEATWTVTQWENLIQGLLAEAEGDGTGLYFVSEHGGC